MIGIRVARVEEHNFKVYTGKVATTAWTPVLRTTSLACYNHPKEVLGGYMDAECNLVSHTNIHKFATFPVVPATAIPQWGQINEVSFKCTTDWMERPNLILATRPSTRCLVNDPV